MAPWKGAGAAESAPPPPISLLGSPLPPDCWSLDALQGIKDVQFNNDGRKFLSTGYDKVIKLWDTETGQAIRTFGEGKMFFVAKFHPNDDKQNVLVAGCQDKKVPPQSS